MKKLSLILYRKMRKQEKKLNKGIAKIFALFLLVVLLSFTASAFTTNGTEKTFNFAVTSGKNAELSGSNYKVSQVIGDITSVVNSSNFRTELGFLRTLPYLDGESCQITPECLGGFCCSGVCQSSSCPVQAESAPAAAAGGGGGSGAVEDFSIDKDLIKALIKQGGTYQTQFTITNTGTETLSFEIDYSSLSGMMILSDTKFSLAPSKVRTIDVTIFASEKQKPDVYSGNIMIKGNSVEKSLPVIIEVQAKEALFDIIVKVVPDSKNVLKTEKVTANITLINVGDLKPVDAVLDYAIRDIEGRDLAFGSETLAVYNEVHRIKELELPLDIRLGTYLFYARVSYGTESAAAGDVFYVVAEKPASCKDGIKNQDEEGIDCGGQCRPCGISALKSIWLFIRNYLLSIFFIIISVAIAAIAIILFRRRKQEEAQKTELRGRIETLSKFIELALSRGYKGEHIKSMLMAKGWPENIVDNVLDKVLLDKLRELEAKLELQYEQEKIRQIK